MGESVAMSEGPFKPSIEQLVNEIKGNTDNIGLTPEIRTLLKDVESIKYSLEVKNAELSILEAMAMESNDENIVELREQLFSLVKLLYSDKIQELSEQSVRNNIRGPSLISSEAKPLKQTVDTTPSTSSIFRRISKIFDTRTKHENSINQLNDGYTTYSER